MLKSVDDNDKILILISCNWFSLFQTKKNIRYYTVEIGYIKVCGGLYFSMIQYHNGTGSENQYPKRYWITEINISAHSKYQYKLPDLQYVLN